MPVKANVAVHAGEAGPVVKGALVELKDDLLQLLHEPVYLISTLGCTFHTAVLGLYGEAPVTQRNGLYRAGPSC